MLKKIPKNMINLFLKNNLFSCQFFKKLFLFKSLTCFFFLSLNSIFILIVTNCFQ